MGIRKMYSVRMYDQVVQLPFYMMLYIEQRLTRATSNRSAVLLQYIYIYIYYLYTRIYRLLFVYR
jgi:hypothetical protein